MKFNIGEVVSVPEYSINKAIIIGVKRVPSAPKASGIEANSITSYTAHLDTYQYDLVFMEEGKAAEYTYYEEYLR